MERVTTTRLTGRADSKPLSRLYCELCMKSAFALLVASVLFLTGCGGGASSAGSPPIDLSLSGNWQFTLAPPADGSFLGGLQGGFLLQNGGTVTGGVTYAVLLPQLLIPCSNGSATVTGTITGQSATLTAVAGTQTYTLTGTLSLDGLTMAGTYDSTAGTAGDGAPCGEAQTGLQWSAVLVPTLTGSLQGSFHSAGGAAGLSEQVFLATGSVSQSPNTGASSANLTGSVNFVNSVTGLSDYPCFESASLFGQISGNVVTLQLVGSNDSVFGIVGEPLGSLGSTGVNPVIFTPVHNGYILTGAGPSYLVATNSCPGSLENVVDGGDFGNVCLAFNGASDCQQALTLAPVALIFPAQAVGSLPTTQIITLTNTSSSAVGNVTLNLPNSDGVANFTETDDCGVNGVPSLGQPFNLIAGQICEVTVAFAPLETCAVGTPPSQCPSPLNATLVVTSPASETILTVPITGTGIADGADATSENGFGAPGLFAGLFRATVPPWLALGERPLPIPGRQLARGGGA
jgi:hypothetical protein